MVTNLMEIPETGLQTIDSEVHRKRGRPRKLTSSSKVDPHILKEAVKKVKTMSKEYANGDLQSDVWYYQTHRPRMLRNAEIAEDAEDGRITYNVQRVAGMTADDQRAIHRYKTSKEEIFFLRKAVMEIQDKDLRETAVDMILHGIGCAQLTQKYGISERALYKRKRKIVEHLASSMTYLFE